MRSINFAAIIVSLSSFITVALAASIPPQVKQVVGFIYIAGKDGKPEPKGTAFLVRVKSTQNPDRAFGYVVTAKHVLQYQPDPKQPERREWFANVSLRLNTKDGKSDFLNVPIVVAGAKKTVFLHEDPTVDIAIIPGTADTNRFDFKVLPDEIITTEKDFRELKITEGSEVFFTGLFTPYTGTLRNYPIVRFGRVALITDERINFVGAAAHLYLIESGSYGGNSGSPVYFYLGSDREAGTLTVGPPIIKLAGVISGSFLDLQPIAVIETATVPIARSNMGIAAVTPAYKLYEILFGSELKKHRGE